MNGDTAGIADTAQTIGQGTVQETWTVYHMTDSETLKFCLFVGTKK